MGRSLGVHPNGGGGGGARLRISLFGNISILAGDDATPLAIPHRLLATLAYLLLHQDEVLSRAHLASVLWPDEDETRGRARLRANLHALSRALPPPFPGGAWLTSDAENVAWNSHAPLWLDVSEFQRRAAAPERWHEAIALYRGDLAAGLNDDWLLRERERLRRLFAATLEELINANRRQRNFSAAIVYSERLLEADPWREDVLRRLVVTRYESGDRAGALASYDAFAARLREEMDTDPMPETRMVRDRVASGGESVVGKTAGNEVASTHDGQHRAFPFVGRSDELHCLIERWHRAAQSGNGGVVVIGGEAGIGKSRLADELARYVEENGGRILRGSASYPTTTPYQCFIEALRLAMPLVATIELSPVWLAALGSLLPEVRELSIASETSSSPQPPKLDPERERQRLLEAIVRTVLALAKPRPLLLILEDLHWADEATIDALTFLARRVPLAPVLIVATHRDEETPGAHPLRKMRRELRTQGLMEQLTPPPLGVADVNALIARIPALRGSEAADLAALLHGRSEGSPLFLTHLIQARIDGRLDDGPPQMLEALVATQLERIDPSARTLAEIGSLIGHQFSTEVLEEVTGWDARTVARALDILIERRLVRELTAGGGRFEYGFTHQLVQSAIANAIPADQARLRHRRIGLVLERLYAGDPHELAAMVAVHFEAAGDEAEGAQHYLEAAKHALTVGAHDMALAHLERGLALSAAINSAALRAQLLLEREALLHVRGERTAQRADLDELERIAGATGVTTDDGELRCEILHRRFLLAHAVGERLEEAEHLEALRSCVNTESARWMRALRLAEADYFRVLGHFDDALAAARAALALCDDAPHRHLQRVEALCLLARIEALRDNASESHRLVEEAELNADSALARCRVLEHRAHAAVQGDDFVALEALCTQLSQAYRAMGDRKGEAAALTWMGVALLRLNRYGEALALFDDAHAICIEIDDRPRAATILVNRSHLDMTLGSLPEAAAALEEAIAIHEQQRDFTGAFTCITNLSAVHAYMGNGRRARELALAALERARERKSLTYEALALENVAEAEAAAGDYPAAIEAMEAALDRRREIGSTIAVGWGLAHLAVWYARRGDLDAAQERIETMLASQETISTGNPWPQYSYWAAAQIYRLCGHVDRVPALLERAQALMMEQAQHCPTPERRRLLLELAWHREIAAAHDFDRWPDLKHDRPVIAETRCQTNSN